MRSDSANLDFLRAVAVLLVYASHLIQLTGSYKPTIVWEIGRSGVLLFFVHTSLVLMMSLERLRKTDQPLFRSFYLRRAFRIYPLSICCVILVLAFHVPNGYPFTFHTTLFHPASTGTIVSNLALIQNLTLREDVLAPLWSLPLEVQMYLALPLLFLWATSVRRLVLLFVLAVPLGLLQPWLSARLGILGYVPCFLAGVLAYRLRPERHFPAWIWGVAVPALIGMFALANYFADHSHWAQWGLCVATGWLAPRFHEIRLPALRQVTHAIAKYSYGIYLSHLPVMFLAFIVVQDPLLRWAVLIAGSVAIPVISYHLVEHPLIQVGGRLAASLPARPTPRQLEAVSGNRN